MKRSKPTPQLIRSTKLKRPALPIVIGVLIALQLLVPYRGWVVLLVGLGGAWLIATLWARSLASGLEVERETRFTWKHVGDTLLERFTLTNRRWASAEWLELIDHSTLLGGKVVTGVSGHSFVGRHQQAVCRRRGLFTIGPTTLRSGDPFGIYEVEVHDPSTASLMVMPRIVHLPGVEVASGGRAGEGRSRRVLLERTVSAATVTEYSPRDSLNWIHWPTSARLGSLFVRQFDNTPGSDWWIALDLDEQAHVGEDENSSEEAAIVIAASLAEKAIQSHQPVGLAADDGKVWLPPSTDAGQRWEIMRALALASTSGSSLGASLQNLRGSLRGLSSLIIISPSTNPDWVGDLYPLLQMGTVATVLLLDPASFGGSASLSAVIEALARAGVRHSVIPRELLVAEPEKLKAGRLELTSWEPL